METGDVIKLTFPNNPEYAFLVQQFVREIAKTIGFGGSSLNQIDIAIEEAVSNVVVHTHDEENPTFDILCEKIGGGIKITLKEMGIPFDPEKLKKYELSNDPNTLGTSGLGIYLIQKVMDGLWFKNLGIKGKETIMVKYLPGNAAKSECPECPEIIHQEPKVISEKIAYDIRGMQEDEAIEISRCAYKTHGYTFFDDHIYYPERLVEMIKTNQMISGVAVTKDNTFMGHAAFLYQHPEAPIAELTFVFVNVEYRGQGALNRLVEYLYNVPKTRVLKGIYAYAVTNHLFTQKSMLKFGINDCGILVATSPNSWKFKGISDDTTQRISTVLSFKYMTPPRKQTLFVPEHHHEMIEKLYRNIGADNEFVVIKNQEISFEEPCAVIESELNELESCAEIAVLKYGQDAFRQVRILLKNFCIQQVAAIQLFIRLDDPLTCQMTAEFEKLGFFFAGILPESRMGDVLILQYLNNVEFDYDKMHILTDLAKELSAYIKARDPNIIK